MPRLLHDRYLAHDARHAWDLATGALVPLDPLSPHTAAGPPLPNLAEALDHGREGTPRVITVDVAPGTSATDLVGRAAAEACARGYVPLDVGAYRRLRSLVARDLEQRTLLLIAGPGTPKAEAHDALVGAAADSPRPHLLLIVHARDAGAGGLHAREARPAYGGPLAGGRRPAAVTTDVAYQLARADRAATFLASGRHAAAERLLREVIGALVRREAHVAAARVGLRLGRLLLGRGRAVHADRALDEAASCAGRGSDAVLACDLRLWQALARTDAGQLTRAESLARAVAASLPATGRRAADAVLARVLLWQRRVSDASALDLEAPTDAAGHEAWDAWIDAMAVRLRLARGDLFGAGLLARALVAREESRGDPEGILVARLAHLRVLAACGDLYLADAALRLVIQAARTVRLPLPVIRARLVWTEMLRRAGRGREADRLGTRLLRFRTAMPPLLRRALEASARGESVSAATTERQAITMGPSPLADEASAAALLIGAAQQDEHDAGAVRHVLERTAPLLACSRIDLWSADAGPASVIMSHGAGLETTAGARAIEAGIPIATDPGAARELAVPVRLGARLVAALAARWPLDRTPPRTAAALLEVAAAVVAPRVEGMLASARDEARAATAIPELVGVSAAMTDLRGAVARAAAAPFNVLIEGESGVGKELVARAIHQLSCRRERRFCDVNCAAIPDELLESELFGHARGAFTGAVTERAGLFEEAHGGTLFLDEVADLSARAQAKLLRVLQQQEIRRVGESFARPVDARVVSAANRDLRTAAAEGRFRQDLLYRLARGTSGRWRPTASARRRC
jgi:hypothetical protein